MKGKGIITTALGVGALMMATGMARAADYGYTMPTVVIPTYKGSGQKPTEYTAKGTIGFFGTRDSSCVIGLTIVTDGSAPPYLPANDEVEWIFQDENQNFVYFDILNGQTNQTYATCPDAASGLPLNDVGTVFFYALIGDGKAPNGDWAFIADVANAAGIFKSIIGGQEDYTPPDVNYNITLSGFGTVQVPGAL